jgi:hypothetical protein
MVILFHKKSVKFCRKCQALLFQATGFKIKRIETEDAFPKISPKKNPRGLELMTFTLVTQIQPDPDVQTLMYLMPLRMGSA